MVTRECVIKGCDKPYYARGMCGMHYQRNRLFGSPTSGVGAHHAPPAERFQRRFEKTDGCWLWQGSKTNSGYGSFQAGGKGSPTMGAHRYAFFLANGFYPEVVMHSCDNKLCVNPAHLKAGDYAANTADMIAKGRRANIRAVGDKNYNTKLTPDDVRVIRARQGESAASVGRDFGVNHGTILAIWRGITWREVV